MEFLSRKDKLRFYSKCLYNLSAIGGIKKTSAPIIIWRLTKRCNLKCIHCSHHLNKDKIVTENLIKTAHKIAASDTMVVDVSGGEPLLVPNIREILLILKNAGKIVMINTNGYHLREHADFLIENGIDYIAVSFDSHLAEVHDKIRGKEGSFNKAIEGIRYIKDHRKLQKPYLLVRGVVMNDNFDGMSDYAHFFDNLVDEVKFQPIHDYEGYDEVFNKDALIDIKKKEVEESFNLHLKSLINSNKKFNNSYYKNFGKFLFHKDELEQEALNYCLPVWFILMIIDEKGKCYSCVQQIGDVLSNNTVDEIWNHPIRLDYITSLAKFGRCRMPCLLTCTGVGQSWQGKLIKKSLSLRNVNKEYQDVFQKVPNVTGF